MFKKMRKLLSGNKGFTLLELIVVVAIMGFLVAMVAPRFAGMVTSAVDPICDTNQQRLAGVTATFNEQTNGLPNMLTNLATFTDVAALSAGAALDDTTYWDGDKTGDGHFAKEFVERNNFHVHTLNADEAAEIRGMGISQFIGADGDTTDVAAGVNVLMIGAGAAAGADLGTPVSADVTYGEPDQMYRIVLGVGPRSELVSEGLLTAAGTCPASVQNEDYIDYGNYAIVLPRLEATVARIDSTANVNFSAVGYEEDGTTVVETITGAINEAQESWAFATQCPEGHRWPGLESETYELTFS